MAKNEFIKCKTCGGEMAKNAKYCPHCGAPNKKPVYKQAWFYCLCTIPALALVAYKYKNKWLEEHEYVNKLLNLYNQKVKKPGVLDKFRVIF